MEEKNLRQILQDVQQGTINLDDAVEQLKTLPYEEVEGFARLDHHRSIRTGFPEVVLGQGKTVEQIDRIVEKLAQRSDRVLVTRILPEAAKIVQAHHPEMVYHPAARALVLDRTSPENRPEGVLVMTAGTADIPVAEEAALTAELMGNCVQRIFDVGVAGLHRLLDRLPDVRKARVVVVVAGMDGALPSVVGGLVSAPVIAVPTSVGYGANFGGLAALLTMLNSCATGVAVVNIDNGFGAGYLAGLINLQAVNNKSL